jgi:predicted ArsR family transcriptional regulator
MTAHRPVVDVDRDTWRPRPRQAEVLDLLRSAGQPLGVADVADRLGIHANTARFHLDALVADGAAVRTLSSTQGPGRPRAVYAPRQGMNRDGVRGYQFLAQILLSWLSATGPGAAASATQAGRTWGAFLAERPAPFRAVTAEASIGRLTGLLDELGFDPAPVHSSPAAGPPSVIRLRHCPFLELAEGYDQVVCAIHLGLMQGALTGLGAPVTAARLEPFAEPGACLAHLQPVPMEDAR